MLTLKHDKSEKTQCVSGIAEEISRIRSDMNNNNALFNIAEDGDLLDSLIYEQIALEKRYVYLIKLAKSANLKM
ncbi:hypothetical protein FACS189499_01570 [Clostridia bacterium]|nr:hypothetical protein FACS189499_01570 [Clostridia bacterium]